MTATEWNAKYPIGTHVRYTPVLGRPETEDTTTRSIAWPLGSGHAVVSVAGRSGGVSLAHLTVIGKDGAA